MCVRATRFRHHRTSATSALTTISTVAGNSFCAVQCIAVVTIVARREGAL